MLQEVTELLFSEAGLVLHELPEGLRVVLLLCLLFMWSTKLITCCPPKRAPSPAAWPETRHEQGESFQSRRVGKEEYVCAFNVHLDNCVGAQKQAITLNPKPIIVHWAIVMLWQPGDPVIWAEF